MLYNAGQDVDANFKVLNGLLPFKAKKTITFAGGTTDAIGDDGGALDPFTIFTVTGDVQLILFGICQTDLAGANATLEVGIAGNTAFLIAQTTATTIDQYEVIQYNATPAQPAVLSQDPVVVAHGADIIGTIGTADITAGVIDFYAFWRPLSSDGNVVGD